MSQMWRAQVNWSHHDTSPCSSDALKCYNCQTVALHCSLLVMHKSGSVRFNSKNVNAELDLGSVQPINWTLNRMWSNTFTTSSSRPVQGSNAERLVNLSECHTWLKRAIETYWCGTIYNMVTPCNVLIAIGLISLVGPGGQVDIDMYLGSGCVMTWWVRVCSPISTFGANYRVREGNTSWEARDSSSWGCGWGCESWEHNPRAFWREWLVCDEW